MSQRFFYGWVVLAAAFVVITMSIGTLFTLGVFLKPIEDSMGWSRSGIGAIGLFNWIVMGAGGVVSGFGGSAGSALWRRWPVARIASRSACVLADDAGSSG